MRGEREISAELAELEARAVYPGGEPLSALEMAAMIALQWVLEREDVGDDAITHVDRLVLG